MCVFYEQAVNRGLNNMFPREFFADRLVCEAAHLDPRAIRLCIFNLLSRNRSGVCRCGYLKSQHVDEAIKPDSCTDEIWNGDRHTREVPTDAFGKISFGSLGQRSGKVKASFCTAFSLYLHCCCTNIPT